MVGCLFSTSRRAQADSYDTLATKATQYSARLLKKPDQCRAVAKASFLFASSSVHIARGAMLNDDNAGGASKTDNDAIYKQKVR